MSKKILVMGIFDVEEEISPEGNGVRIIRVEGRATKIKVWTYAIAVGQGFKFFKGICMDIQTDRGVGNVPFPFDESCPEKKEINGLDCAVVMNAIDNQRMAYSRIERIQNGKLIEHEYFLRILSGNTPLLHRTLKARVAL